jgi:undecaprenyl diphosphate synthase|tara:strand:- start:454 stop:1152 length:699 start_codon:yes stop_codon:yes gene_type:complete
MKPNHIAIIMDGNGRWAENCGKGRKFGHQKGAKSAREVVRYIGSLGIEYLTLYAFSTENWGRPIKEVNLLMSLFIETLDLEISDLNDNNVKIKFIGDRSSLKDSLVKKIEKAEILTTTNQGLKLSVALAYGGRWDIINAAKNILKKIKKSEVNPSDLDEKLFSSSLQLGGNPDPDLLIRTGGERRISNFLLWNIAYTELYFDDVLWPEFSKNNLDQAIEFYKERKRRYGKNV